MAAGRFKSQRGGRLVTYAERIDDSGVMHNVTVERRADRETTSVTMPWRPKSYPTATAADATRSCVSTRYRGVPCGPDL